MGGGYKTHLVGPSDDQPLPPKLKVTAVSVVFVGHTAREGTPALLGLPPLQRPTARAPCTLQSAERDAVPPQGGPPVGPTPQSRSPRGRPVRLQEQKEHLATHGPGGNRVRETLCWGPVRRVWRRVRLRKRQAGRRAGWGGEGLYSRSRRSLGTEGCGTNGPLLPGGALLARGCRDSPAPRARLSLAPRWRRVAGTLVLDTLRDNIGVVRDTWLKASQTFICPRITWKSSDTDAAPAGLG